MATTKYAAGTFWANSYPSFKVAAELARFYSLTQHRRFHIWQQSDRWWIGPTELTQRQKKRLEELKPFNRPFKRCKCGRLK